MHQQLHYDIPAPPSASKPSPGGGGPPGAPDTVAAVAGWMGPPGGTGGADGAAAGADTGADTGAYAGAWPAGG